MVMIYAGGHVSGGHDNPAVTLAALVRGRIGPVDAVGYWVAQLGGGLLAMALARWVVHPAQVLNVATSNSHPNNSFYGLAIERKN
jgi:aquaporin Z